MSRVRKNQKIASLNTQEEAIHLRLCHVCLKLNEASEEIVQCQHCQHYLTIDVDNFDLSLALENEDEMEDEDDEAESETLTHPGVGHITGLSVLW